MNLGIVLIGKRGRYFMKKILVLVISLMLLMLFVSGYTSNEKQNFITEYYTLQLKEGELRGTLTIPKENSPHPIALIISGAGAVNRDGNNRVESLNNNHLKMLSEELGRAGIASLRYDKRGIGQSSNLVAKPEDLIFEDYINDAVEWIKKIKSDIRFNRFYIIGHSEGGLVGAATANQVDIDGFVSISAPGIPLHETLIKQLEKKDGTVSERNLEIIEELRNGNTVPISPKELGPLFNPSAQPYLISLFKHEPQSVISKVNSPILIIQGDNDLQSTILDAKTLHKAGEGELVIIKGMNHILKDIAWDDNANIRSYNKPKLPLHENLLEELVGFIFEDSISY